MWLIHSDHRWLSSYSQLASVNHNSHGELERTFAQTDVFSATERVVQLVSVKSALELRRHAPSVDSAISGSNAWLRNVRVWSSHSTPEPGWHSRRQQNIQSGHRLDGSVHEGERVVGAEQAERAIRRSCPRVVAFVWYAGYHFDSEQQYNESIQA